MAPQPFRLADKPDVWYYIDGGKAHRIPSPAVLHVLMVLGVITPNPFAMEDGGVATIGRPDEIRDMRNTYGLL